MADTRLCTCCALQTSMSYSAGCAVGLVVPFCSVEHQQLVSGFRSGKGVRPQYRAGARSKELTRVMVTRTYIRSTRKVICGRVLEDPYVESSPHGARVPRFLSHIHLSRYARVLIIFKSFLLMVAHLVPRFTCPIDSNLGTDRGATAQGPRQLSSHRGCTQVHTSLM